MKDRYKEHFIQFTFLSRQEVNSVTALYISHAKQNSNKVGNSFIE